MHPIDLLATSGSRSSDAVRVLKKSHISFAAGTRPSTVMSGGRGLICPHDETHTIVRRRFIE
jgi:hypothetical protein